MSVVGRAQLLNRNGFSSRHTKEKIRSNLLRRKIIDLFFLSSAQIAVQNCGNGLAGTACGEGSPVCETARQFCANAHPSGI